MPLAAHERRVSGRPKRLAERDAIAVELALVAWDHFTVLLVGSHHVADSRLVLIETSQQRGTRWAAPRGVVELAKPQTVLGQRIDVGGFDFTAVAADI